VASAVACFRNDRLVPPGSSLVNPFINIALTPHLIPDLQVTMQRHTEAITSTVHIIWNRTLQIWRQSQGHATGRQRHTASPWLLPWKQQPNVIYVLYLSLNRHHMDILQMITSTTLKQWSFVPTKYLINHNYENNQQLIYYWLLINY